jgi:hypothetical protein
LDRFSLKKAISFPIDQDNQARTYFKKKALDLAQRTDCQSFLEEGVYYRKL